MSLAVYIFIHCCGVVYTSILSFTCRFKDQINLLREQIDESKGLNESMKIELTMYNKLQSAQQSRGRDASQGISITLSYNVPEIYFFVKLQNLPLKIKNLVVTIFVQPHFGCTFISYFT